MPRRLTKIISIFICFLLIFQQSGFTQIAGELNLSSHFLALRNTFIQDRFRPLHLRYLSYDPSANNFNLLLDKGDFVKGLSPKGRDPKESLQQETKTLLNYFFIGISLPNEAFWVNLRPDAADNIIDSELAETDVGKVLLEADLQLKKDTANFTSPQTSEGKDYWDKLYKKAEELYGNENITIPTLTRPWIVPDEIIIRESSDNAYIYKATLKVMLEQDYLKDSSTYNFKDQRSKALNEYSSQLIRETIIPKLTKEINSSKRYAPLRQVYYSLILAQWFKQKFYGKSGVYSYLIDRHNLTGLTSKNPWSKTTYFNAYKTSFQQGEYNIKEPVYTPTGQIIRSYMSGGIGLGAGVSSAITAGVVPSMRDRRDSQNKPIPGYELKIQFRGGSVSSPFEPQKIEIEKLASRFSSSTSDGEDQRASSAMIIDKDTKPTIKEQEGSILRAMYENVGDDNVQLDNLRRLLSLKGIAVDVETWIGQQGQKMSSYDRNKLEKALSLIGLTRQQAAVIIDHIVLIDLPLETHFEGRIPSMGGMLINTPIGYKIIIPNIGLIQHLQNKEYLAMLLYDVVKFRLVAQGIDEIEAEQKAWEAEEDFIGSDANYGEEFNRKVRRGGLNNTFYLFKAQQVFSLMEIQEVSLMDDAPDGGAIYQVYSSDGNRYIVFVNTIGEIIGIAVSMEPGNSFGMKPTGTLKDPKLHAEYRILPEESYPLFAEKFHPYMAANNEIQDRREEFGSYKTKKSSKLTIFLSAINVYYGLEQFRNDYINNSIIRNLLKQIGFNIPLAFYGHVLLFESAGQAITYSGVTWYSPHSLLSHVELHHAEVAAHEYAHVLFRRLSKDAKEELSNYFLGHRQSLADIITMTPAYKGITGSRLLTEMISFIVGSLADGEEKVYVSGYVDDIYMSDIDILIRHGFLPEEFKGLFSNIDNASLRLTKLNLELLTVVYPQASSSPLQDESAGSPAVHDQSRRKGIDLPAQNLISVLGPDEIASYGRARRVVLYNAQGEEIVYTITPDPQYSEFEKNHPKMRRVTQAGQENKVFWMRLGIDAMQRRIIELIFSDAESSNGIWRGELLRDADGFWFLVSPALEGENLGVAMAQMDIGQFMQTIFRIADILHALHEKGITYQDVHPGNIYITDAGSIYFLPDFGRSGLNLTASGNIEKAIPGHRMTDIAGLASIVLDYLEKKGFSRVPLYQGLVDTARETAQRDKEYQNMASFKDALRRAGSPVQAGGFVGPEKEELEYYMGLRSGDGERPALIKHENNKWSMNILWSLGSLEENWQEIGTQESPLEKARAMIASIDLNKINSFGGLYAYVWKMAKSRSLDLNPKDSGALAKSLIEFIEKKRNNQAGSLDFIRGPVINQILDKADELISAAGSPVADAISSSPAQKEVGGIDMRSLPKHTKVERVAAGSPLVKQGQSPSGTAPVSDKEWQEIERMASSGIAPSCERIREYLLSLQDPSSQTDQVLACIADILRQEEEKACGTESSLKEILVLLESDKPVNELRLALAKVQVLAKEPELIVQ